MGWKNELTRIAKSGLRAAVRSVLDSSGKRPQGNAARGGSAARGSAARSSGDRTRPTTPGSGTGAAYPGDFTGKARLEYRPLADGKPDPGEVVWAWVPYEEDFSQGKDRPALVIAEDDGWLLALMLTSKDHDDDRSGRNWMDIGTGDWDSKRRPSEVRLDRIIRLDPDGVRREGGRLDKKRFDQVAAGVTEANGW